MRLLSLLLIITLFSWTSYWYFSSKEIYSDIDTYIANNSTETTWSYENISVTGYPYRLDTKISSLTVSDIDLAWSITLNRFDFLSLIYKRNHHIMAIKAPVKLSSKNNKIEINEGIIKSSLKLSNENIINDLITESNFFKFSLNDFGNLSLTELVGALKFQEIKKGYLYRGHLKFKDLLRGEEQGIKNEAAQQERILINNFTLHGDLLLKKPFPSNKLTVELFKSIKRINAQFQIGDALIRLVGDLKISGSKSIDGKIVFSVARWNSLLDRIERNNIFEKEKIKIIRGGLILSELSRKSSEGFVELPLLIKENKIFLGPVLVGSIPSKF